MTKQLLGLSLLSSASSWACSVCGAGTTVDQGTYMWMSIIISLLPLGMIGGVIYWVARSIRAQDKAMQPTTPVRSEPAEVK